MVRMAVCATLAATALAALVAVQAVALPAFSMAAIGRLEGEDGGVCTAFVVASVREEPGDGYGLTWRNLVVSAGHCGGGALTFRPHRVQGDRWVEAAYTHRVHRVFPVAISLRPEGWDLLVGRFFTPVEVPSLLSSGRAPVAGELLTVVGYGGGVLGASTGRLLGAEPNGWWAIEGWVRPGSSGSPVLDADGRVVAVAVAVKLRPGSSALVCALGGRCERERVYYATPIVHLRGLVQLPAR